MQRLQQIIFIPRTGIYLLSRLHDFMVHFNSSMIGIAGK